METTKALMKYYWIYILLMFVAVVSGCRTKNTLTTCHTEENKTSSATDNDILSTTENSIFSAMSFCDSLPRLSSQLIERDDSLPGKNYYETLRDNGVIIKFPHTKEWCGVSDPVNNIKWLNNLVNNLADTLLTYYTTEKAYKHYSINIWFMGWKLSSANDSTHIVMLINENGYHPYIKAGHYIFDKNGNTIGSYCDYKQLENDLQLIYNEKIKLGTNIHSFSKYYRALGVFFTKTSYYSDSES